MGAHKDRRNFFAVLSMKSGSGNNANSGAGEEKLDPFLVGVNCYCEIFMKIPDATLSGVSIDPKGVTVYPATKFADEVFIQNEVLTGKYIMWNSAGDAKGHIMLN